MINEDEIGQYRIQNMNQQIGVLDHEGHASPIQQFAQIPDRLLDEDIGSTFSKEFKGVVYKFWLVLFPINAEAKISILKNWDLWGPAILAAIFLLVIGTDDKFDVILYSLLAGASLVNWNIRTIGGKISYFQSLSILGYSIFPLLFTTIILKVLTIFQIRYMGVIMISQLIATVWSIICIIIFIKAAKAFVAANIKPNRTFVAVVPIGLVYCFVASHFTFYVYYSKAWKEGTTAIYPYALYQIEDEKIIKLLNYFLLFFNQ